MSKKGFFFSIDAFLACMLLVAGIILITQHVQEPLSQERTVQYSQDVLSALNTMQLKEIQHAWVQTRIANGSIENPQLPVLEYIAQLWATNQTTAANELSQIILGDILPADFSLRLEIEDDVLFTTPTNGSGQVSSARRMVSGVAKGEALQGSTGFGFLQKVTNKDSNTFAYFGGFVGQGDIAVRLDNLPSDINTTNVQHMLLEGEFDGDFTLWFNGAQCGATYSASPADQFILSYNISSCANLLQPGNNSVELQFTGLANGSVSGGFVQVAYRTSEFSQAISTMQTQYYLPNIDGVINYYDGLIIPGDLTNLSLYLHYEVEGSDRPIFFDVGNTTIYESNASGDITVTLSNTYLSSLLDFSLLSNTTVPMRFGYYEGNNTNNSGNISDVYLVTSRAGPMQYADIIGTTETRMEAAIRLNKLFTNTILNATGNSEGLVSYWASNGHDHALSADNDSLQSTIDGYTIQNPSQSQRDLCGAMEEARDRLVASDPARKRSILLMTDGDTTKCCSGGGQCTAQKARQDAIDVACDYYDTTKITYYTVGFGQDVTNDPDVRDMLTEIASCTGGNFSDSSNITALEEIYQEFASQIAQSSIVYTFQRITEAANVNSTLFDDSYFFAEYTSDLQTPGPTQLGMTLQTPQFGSCTPTIEIPSQLNVVDARMVSYSGDFWTKHVLVDGVPVYNLSTWGSDYQLLGDPAEILIPNYLLSPGNHTFSLALGANASVDETCSLNNSLVYTALINTTVSYGGVRPESQGCNWQVQFEDGTFLNFTVPSTYVGTNNCTYTSSSISYNADDAYDEVVFRILDKLDFDSDGQIFLNLDESDLEIIVSLVSQVPYLWGPSIAKVVVSR